MKESDHATERVGIVPRYLEVDFFRGLALIVMFWNHLLFLIQETGFLDHAPIRIHYGLSDSATIFVFLSGFVSGLVYDGYLKSRGFYSSQTKALKRSGQIYLAQLVTLVVLLMGTDLIPHFGSVDPLQRNFSAFFQYPAVAFSKFLALQSFPELFDILPLYILLLPFVPLMVLGLKRYRAATIMISLLLYATMQLTRSFNAALSFSGWSFNPLAWQLLFMLGLLIAVQARNSALHIPRNRCLAFLAGLVSLYFFLDLRAVEYSLHLRRLMGKPIDEAFAGQFLIDKSYLGPMVLLHFVSIAYLIWMILPRIKNIVSGRIGRLLVACGQHSLPLYCGGVILNYTFAGIIVRMGGTIWSFIGLGLIGWTMILIAGALIGKRSKEKFSITTAYPSLSKS